MTLDAIRAAIGDRWPVAEGPGWLLVHGDCRLVLPVLPDDSADHWIADPPYSDHTHSKQWIGAALTANGAKRVKTAHKGLGFAPISEAEAMEAAAQAARIAARWIGNFTDVEGVDLWRRAVVAAGLDYVRTCIWDKVDGAPQFTGDRPAAGAEAFVVAHPSGKKRWNGGGKRNVYRHAVNAEKGAKPHPSTKPFSLMEEIEHDFTDVGDLILDPYCGSGSTGVAAVRRGRLFVGIERLPLPDRPVSDENPDYFGIAARLLAGGSRNPDPRQIPLFDSVPA